MALAVSPADEARSFCQRAAVPHCPPVFMGAAAVAPWPARRGPRRRYCRGVLLVDADRFEVLVGDALDRLPAALGEMMENIVVVVEDAHPDEDLLGLYEGVPLTERENYGGLAMPDRVTVYRLAICAICDSEDDLLDEIMVTVVHEVAHHFGIDDETLHHLGWD